MMSTSPRMWSGKLPEPIDFVINNAVSGNGDAALSSSPLRANSATRLRVGIDDGDVGRRRRRLSNITSQRTVDSRMSVACNRVAGSASSTAYRASGLG